MDTNVNYDDYTTDEELDNYNEVFIESNKIIENENYNSETPVRNLNGFDKYLDTYTPDLIYYCFVGLFIGVMFNYYILY